MVATLEQTLQPVSAAAGVTSGSTVVQVSVVTVIDECRGSCARLVTLDGDTVIVLRRGSSSSEPHRPKS